MIQLDAIDGINLPDDHTGYGNELNRLQVLSEGLTNLYQAVRNVENQCAAQLVGSSQYLQWGGMPGVPLGFIECAFHWYSVSLCNYCGLIGHIAHELGLQDDKGGATYRNRVCGPAKVYRDKISAHFARYDPKRDNAADIAWSVIDSPNFVNGRFAVGCWTMTQTRSGESSTTKHNMNWELTTLHEELEGRFGPNLMPRRIDSSENRPSDDL